MKRKNLRTRTHASHKPTAHPPARIFSSHTMTHLNAQQCCVVALDCRISRWTKDLGYRELNTRRQRLWPALDLYVQVIRFKLDCHDDSDSPADNQSTQPSSHGAMDLDEVPQRFRSTRNVEGSEYRETEEAPTLFSQLPRNQPLPSAKGCCGTPGYTPKVVAQVL